MRGARWASRDWRSGNLRTARTRVGGYVAVGVAETGAARVDGLDGRNREGTLPVRASGGAADSGSDETCGDAESRRSTLEYEYWLRGGIGRRARLRIWSRERFRFDPGRGHQSEHNNLKEQIHLRNGCFLLGRNLSAAHSSPRGVTVQRFHFASVQIPLS
jgi:hypothetical protein